MTRQPHPQIRVIPPEHPLNHAPVSYDGGRVLLKTATDLLANRTDERDAATEILYVINEWARWRQEFDASTAATPSAAPNKPDV